MDNRLNHQRHKEAPTMYVIDTPEGIAHYRMASIIAMLTTEVRTGMKYSRGSLLTLVQQQYGVQSRTKKAALEEMRRLYATTYGREYGQE